MTNLAPTSSAVPASRASALTKKHASLEAQIETELGRPQPDTALLKDLKKQKLAIKDTLAA